MFLSVNVVALFGALLVGIMVYATVEALMAMRRHPMVSPSEADDWERLEGVDLSTAARRHYRDSASVVVKTNEDGEESYVKVDPTPFSDEDTAHVAFAFENDKTGDVRFFRGKRYREWDTRDDVPTMEVADVVVNHVVSLCLGLLASVGVYGLLVTA